MNERISTGISLETFPSAAESFLCKPAITLGYHFTCFAWVPKRHLSLVVKGKNSLRLLFCVQLLNQDIEIEGLL